MFIQTEETPNPNSLKFLPGEMVMESGTVAFTDVEDAAAKSPLAERLLGIAGVEGVFYGHDFITISKGDDAQWFVLKPPVLGAIMEHFTRQSPLFIDDAQGGVSDTPVILHDPADEPIVAQITELLNTRVRPAVANDGGDIILHGFQQGVVYLTMHGACAGCPSSTATLKMGIENLLRHYIPEVSEVRAVL